MIESSRVRFIVQWLPAILGFIATFISLATQVGFLTTTLLAGFVGALLWIVSNRIVVKSTPQSQPTVVQTPKTSASTMRTRVQMSPTLHSVCEAATHNVDAGEDLGFHLDAK